MTDISKQYEHWTKTRINPYLTQDEIYAIGETVVIWGQIEATLQHLIWEYSGLDMRAGMTLTGPMSLSAKKDALLNLVTHIEQNEALKESIKNALKNLADLQSVRNGLVHGFWLLAAPMSYKKMAKSPEMRHYLADDVNPEDFVARSGELANELERMNVEARTLSKRKVSPVEAA